MSRRWGFLLTVPAGLVIGLGLGWAIWGPADRAEAVVAHLDKYCLEFALRHRPVDTDGLEDVSVLPGEQRWFDHRSGLSVQFDDSQCGVSDLFDQLDDAERRRAVELAVAFGESVIAGSTTEDRAAEVEADVFKTVLVPQERESLPALLIVRWMQDPSDISQTATTFTFARPAVGGNDA